MPLMAAQLSLGFDGAPAVLSFVRHRRARRYIIRVLDDGAVRVTLPRWGSLREAQAFAGTQQAWIARQLARVAAVVPAPRSLRPYIERHYRERANRELPVRLCARAAALGIMVGRVAVGDQRSRWGACSSRGTVTLNWRLIRTPEFVCDYVIVHELMHRREMNHSARFWRLVAAHCPRYQEARRWLRQEGRLLFPAR